MVLSLTEKNAISLKHIICRFTDENDDKGGYELAAPLLVWCDSEFPGFRLRKEYR